MAPKPTDLVIGRHTYWDFGPPFSYYELFIVRPLKSGSRIDRILLTPPGQACFQPAKVERAIGATPEPIDALLNSTNPCAIPEKELHREAKKCKKCQRFSGADITVRATCGAQQRVIRADIFEDYWFNSTRKIPEHTSNIMRLLEKLDEVIGKPNASQKPTFDLLVETKEELTDDGSGVLDALDKGQYDSIFPAVTQKPSDLYHAAQVPAALATVKLLSISPLQPISFVMPDYPPIARLARVEGRVIFKFEVDSNGKTKNFEVEQGHPFLKESVKRAVEQWRFAAEPGIRKISATVEFKTNCPTPK